MTNGKNSFIILSGKLCEVGEFLKNIENNVPTVVIKRLPRYYRYLGELMRQGVTRISSAALSKKMEVTASQIRQDLNCFGGFGQQGYGYNIPNLYAEIGEILGLNEKYSIIIIGAGNLGHALVNYASLEKHGFRVIGIFDSDSNKIGTTIKDIQVHDIAQLEDFFANNEVDIAALALPREHVQEIAERLIAIGVKGLWNFSYTEFPVPENIVVENVHLSDSLMKLSYEMKKNNL